MLVYSEIVVCIIYDLGTQYERNLMYEQNDV